MRGDFSKCVLTPGVRGIALGIDINNADGITCTGETRPETDGGCTLAAPPFLVCQYNDFCASKSHRRAFQKKFVYLHTVYLYTAIPPYSSYGLYTKNTLIQAYKNFLFRASPLLPVPPGEDEG
jgi:hypothetical protein